MTRLFFGPSDWISDRSSARVRRAIGFWLGVFFLGPVSLLSIPLRAELWWLLTLSLAALVLSCFAITFAETPVETEDQ